MASKISSSRPSGLLNPKDNHLVFQLLGSRVQSLSTAVVQFFTCSAQENQWTLQVNILFPMFLTFIFSLFRTFLMWFSFITFPTKNGSKKKN